MSVLISTINIRTPSYYYHSIFTTPSLYLVHIALIMKGHTNLVTNFVASSLNKLGMLKSLIKKFKTEKGVGMSDLNASGKHLKDYIHTKCGTLGTQKRQHIQM